MKNSVLLLFSLLLFCSCDYEKPIRITPDYVSVDYKAQKMTFYTDFPFTWLQVMYCKSDSRFEDEVYIVEGDWFRLEGYPDSNRVDLYLDENNGGKRYLYFNVHKLVSLDFAVVIQGSPDKENN